MFHLMTPPIMHLHVAQPKIILKVENKNILLNNNVRGGMFIQFAFLCEHLIRYIQLNLVY